jgi:hypothetical protein
MSDSADGMTIDKDELAAAFATGSAFAAAQDVCKQIIAISTGMVAITVAFVNNLKSGGDLADLHDAWICAGLAVILGLLAMGSLTGILSRTGALKADAIYEQPARTLALFQMLAFLFALGFTISFGLSVS